jgi:glycosyltransferase involved in cell wall biosynthesis
MISFIVPAHNEEGVLAGTLKAIHESARATSQPYEVIVVDDASTDATATVASQNNARVVSVNFRQIAATRNSGARVATGGRFFFVDADTTANPRALAAALRCMDKGAAGGGAPARFEATAPFYGQLLLWWLGLFMRVAEISGGAFMFCTRAAFQATGGFDERLFAAEDAAMSQALKRQGRFVVLWPYVVTSSRRVRGFRVLPALATLMMVAFFPKMLRKRSGVKKVWYESDRGQDGADSHSLAIKTFNGVMLVIMVAIITGPLQALIPWTLTPRDHLPGKIRMGVAIFSCHIGLVLWPCAYFLFRNLFRQTQWLERVKGAALIAICLWFAWGATKVVVWFWPWAFHSAAQLFDS